MEDMQGTLWKWTNYFTGWQPRWFVLESGILSYYRSQDDVNNGCKGSIKMAVCDVNVHATDNTRLDLIIPGEAHFYVKAATPQERQQWLVALGSCKACLGKGKTNDRKAEDVSNDSELRGKRSELRLYCDLLMQQVHSVKDAITLPEGALPEVQKIDEATSLLSATCDTFINTLEQCMMLAQASASSSPAVPLSGSGNTDPAVPSSPARNKSALKTSNPWGPIQRSTSIDSYNFRGGSVSPSSSSSHAMLTPDIVFGYIPNNARGQRTSSKSSASRSRTPSESSELSGNEQKTTLNNNGHVSVPRMSLDSGDVAEVDSDGQTNVQTYFTVMQTSFMDIQLQGDAGIPVVQFLNACQPVLQVFDKLNATAFAPIKLDVAGNIRKIKQKYSSNPEKFVTLQDIVQYEMNNHQHHLSHSATIALLWLKRSLQFIREFMHGILSTRDELDAVANNAYVLTLKQYHSLVVRGVFALAVKAIPYRADFLALFAISDNDLQSPDFERSLMNDIDAYITALDVILRILNDFYTSNGIDSQEQI